MSESSEPENSQITYKEVWQLREKPKPNERQQNKIIASILRGDINLIAEHEVQLEQGEREKYLEQVSKGEIGETQYGWLISRIVPKFPYEERNKEPQLAMRLSAISSNKQELGIIAYFARGDFRSRDYLALWDLGNFLEKFPTALDYEKALSEFLDGIERANGKEKRLEYERSAKALGKYLYGKQWEYLEQIRLLEEEAMAHQPQATGQEGPQETALEKGFEQALQFNRENRLSGQILDGYKDGGRDTQFDNEGRAIDPYREVIVVDRKKDPRLNQMIEKAKKIQEIYGRGLRTVFELA